MGGISVAPAIHRIPKGHPFRQKPSYDETTSHPKSDDMEQDTSAPPHALLALPCPKCERPLSYVSSVSVAVLTGPPETIDFYKCRVGCGLFRNKRGTGELRSTPSTDD
jgi:hypothetical protein